MALLESLARRRPVVIFEDIDHVIEKKRNFCLKKKFLDLFKTLNFIKDNYNSIQNDLRKNYLPTQRIYNRFN